MTILPTKERVVIRTTDEQDVPALERLLRRSWLTTWAPELPFAAVQTFARDDIAGAYARACWCDMHVLEQEGALVGMVHLAENLVGALHIDPAHKGKRLGTQLMSFAESEIKKAGHARCELDVIDFNTGAQAFYRKRGYRKISTFSGEEAGTTVTLFRFARTLS